MANEQLAALRHRIARIEGRSDHVAETRATDPLAMPDGGFGPLPSSDQRLALGIDALDRKLRGGLPRGGLHEVRTRMADASGAATGFVLAVLARLAAVDRRPILWIATRDSNHEAGLLHGPGLAAFGLDPSRLILVTVRNARDALWALEEGLACRGLAAALGEIRGNPGDLDLIASRRLTLKARNNGVMGWLLRPSADAEPSAVLTRWRIEALRSLDGAFAAAIGPPAWRIELERNRFGPVGRVDLEWSHESRRFVSAPVFATLSGRRPAAAVDRPHPSAGTGQIVALRAG